METDVSYSTKCLVHQVSHIKYLGLYLVFVQFIFIYDLFIVLIFSNGIVKAKKKL